jgi:hypothetical protein
MVRMTEVLHQGHKSEPGTRQERTGIGEMFLEIGAMTKLTLRRGAVRHGEPSAGTGSHSRTT